ncbi:hypothetical protein [Pseudomonas sp. SO81]|uniref:hypothetical protein n=1 Tax=Pseudomonas sp. SO81 TaxID=2983246 RepID=UPI0025A45B31|nr:hypothetical protein [Pseudomonas sp. SO81]WJN58224.1 hypothetical protein OH686_05725 [Pseudomonas sp. SO81]
MRENKPFDFASFRAANKDRNVSGIDYLHAIYTSQDLPADFVLWFSKLFKPDFKLLGGMAFVAELFDEARYQGLLGNGQRPDQAQYWSNLLEITGLFDNLTVDQAYPLAERIAESWNLTLTNQFGVEQALARVIVDDDSEEVFVTIGAYNT